MIGLTGAAGSKGDRGDQGIDGTPVNKINIDLLLEMEYFILKSIIFLYLKRVLRVQSGQRDMLGYLASDYLGQKVIL